MMYTWMRGALDCPSFGLACVCQQGTALEEAVGLCQLPVRAVPEAEPGGGGWSSDETRPEDKTHGPYGGPFPISKVVHCSVLHRVGVVVVVP